MAHKIVLTKESVSKLKSAPYSILRIGAKRKMRETNK